MDATVKKQLGGGTFIIENESPVFNDSFSSSTNNGLGRRIVGVFFFLTNKFAASK